MKKLFTYSVVFVLFFKVMFAQPALPEPYLSTVSKSLTKSFVAKAPFRDPNQVLTAEYREVTMLSKYVDGLGRNLQTVLYKGSLEETSANATMVGTPQDLVTAFTYDNLGRESRRFLPFVSNDVTGLLKLNPFQQQSAFYNRVLSNEPGEITGNVTQRNWALGEQVIENAPTGRVILSKAPGVSWVGSNRGKSTEYESNGESEVRLWNYQGDGLRLPVSGEWYSPGQLYKTITKNEDGQVTVEYHDKKSRLILRKQKIQDNAASNQHAGWLSTYFIYDEMDRLRFIISPKATEALIANWKFDATDFKNSRIANELCYAFDKDSRNRIVSKKLAGKGQEDFVYDRRDRLLMYQDANMRNAGKWMVYVYDDRDREIRTGLWNNSSARATHQLQADRTESYPSTGEDFEVYSEKHYDDYSGLSERLNNVLEISRPGEYYTAHNQSPDFAQPLAASSPVAGLLTWSRVRMLEDGNRFIENVFLYDPMDRLIQVKTINPSGGKDIKTVQYNWMGQPLITCVERQWKGSGIQALTVFTRLKYDNLGRNKTIEKKWAHSSINNGALSAYATIAGYEYDALGQLKIKSIGSRKDPATAQYQTPRAALETQQMNYNVRGWLKGVNSNSLAVQSSTGNRPWFGYELGYDKGSNQTNKAFARPNFNGDLGGVIWKSRGDNTNRKYDFSYDLIGRLTKAAFEQSTGDGWSAGKVDFSMGGNPSAGGLVTYDANGNLQTMWQKAMQLNGVEWADQLKYQYFDHSNKLKFVSDDAGSDVTVNDFKDNKSVEDYGYDLNGNLATDLNKQLSGKTGIDITVPSAIRYNFLNLPELIETQKDADGSRVSVQYVYDASGKRWREILKKFDSNGIIVSTTRRNYHDDILYQSSSGPGISPAETADKIQFFKIDDGLLRACYDDSPERVLKSFEYDYFLKDHLGNNRLIITEEVQAPFVYQASMENSERAEEDRFFSQLGETEFPKPPGFDNNQNNQLVSRLYNTSGNDRRIGPGLVLKVMSGDRFKALTTAWYLPNGTNTALLSGAPGVVSALVRIFTGNLPSGTNHSGSILAGSGIIDPSILQFLNTQPQAGTSRPKAFLNWIVLDEQQFQVLKENSGALQIPAITGTMNKQVMQSNGGQEIEITKNGYLYVFVSNESQGSVYFDDLRIEHRPGPLLEEKHYYPFGLEMEGISSRAYGIVQNRMGFHGKELSTGSISKNPYWYDFGSRHYDPQTGRWVSTDPLMVQMPGWSPYSFGFNNPTRFIDPDGRSPRDTLVPLPSGSRIVGTNTNPQEIRTKHLDNAAVSASAADGGRTITGNVTSETQNELEGMLTQHLAGNTSISKVYGLFREQEGTSGIPDQVSVELNGVEVDNLSKQTGVVVVNNSTSQEMMLTNEQAVKLGLIVGGEDKSKGNTIEAGAVSRQQNATSIKSNYSVKGYQYNGPIQLKYSVRFDDVGLFDADKSKTVNVNINTTATFISPIKLK